MTRFVMVALIALAVVIAFQSAVIGSRPTVVDTWREPPWFPAPTDARDIVRLAAPVVRGKLIPAKTLAHGGTCAATPSDPCGRPNDPFQLS